MKFSEGVEWGLHCTVLLANTPDGPPVSRKALAQQYDLPEAYLAKHLNSMVRAGILRAVSGPKGGFRLAKPADQITALEVVEAIEGSGSPFQCQEIRRRGAGAVPAELCTRACTINAVMSSAHNAWRASLRGVTVASILASLPEGTFAGGSSAAGTA